MSKPKKVRGPKRKPGPKKGVPPSPKELKWQERRLTQKDLAACIAELPSAYYTGSKRDSEGISMHWIGYKFQVDVTDEVIPMSAITTSASVHDCQVAIPLMRQTASRIGTVCYELMDAGYIGWPIISAAKELVQVALVARRDKNGVHAVPLDAASKKRIGTSMRRMALTFAQPIYSQLPQWQDMGRTGPGRPHRRGKASPS